MKIWYSVCGEGLGHINRSLPIIDALKSSGYDVTVFSYGHTSKIIDKYIEIPGINFTDDINYRKLFMSFIRFRKNRNIWIENFNNIKPDLIISDFEPVLIKFAKLNNVPCMCIDNQHKFSRIDWSLSFGLLLYNIIAKTYLKTYFDCPSITTTFHPEGNGISPCFTESKRKEILVYVRDCYINKILNICGYVDADFIFYTNNKIESILPNNIKLEKLGTDFKNKLLDADGVITNGGNQLISECIQSKIRFLIFPIEKQYEQYINCHYVRKNGYGATTTIRKISKKLIEDTFLCPKQMSTNQIVEKILNLYSSQMSI